MRLLPNSLRNALTGIALCCVTATAWAQETLPYWKDIQTVGVNREPARTAFMTYENRDQALTMKNANSPYYQLLNGTWSLNSVATFDKSCCFFSINLSMIFSLSFSAT